MHDTDDNDEVILDISETPSFSSNMSTFNVDKEFGGIPFGGFPPSQGGDKIHLPTQKENKSRTRLRELTTTHRAKIRAAQVIAKTNLYPHKLSCMGYKKLEHKMMKEATAFNLSGAFGIGMMVHPPYHDIGKRVTKDHEGSTHPRKQQTQLDTTHGTFTPQMCEDILTAAIGHPKHLERVYGVGNWLTYVNSLEVREEMRKEMSERKKEYCDMQTQLKEEYSNMWTQLLVEVRVELASPSSQPRNPPQCEQSFI
ncbi:hypothetical protein V8G54_003804 [Vigna mungo]|uniref:Uncharacterized protein n=1 Tax=Vigna mungo TaxID=3915 RepID=A0AAQ3PB41_VIGMU